MHDDLEYVVPPFGVLREYVCLEEEASYTSLASPRSSLLFLCYQSLGDPRQIQPLWSSAPHSLDISYSLVFLSLFQMSLPVCLLHHWSVIKKYFCRSAS
ncbi:hypothetical protein CSUI_003510 [Cystoisospora suis]|uniref:Uncharacterized protein n=1 Tax=Cystoisospora suis TaxID=483139 RepID=A0A2C6L0I3_9APIC|nr:hypothetical protein CSUI_003510 [Cystoisospora suis]